MTIYSIKLNKHETAKTTQLHEAREIAKKTLINKLAEKGLYPVSVNEKMYLNNGKVSYRIFASIYEKNWQGISRVKTYSVSVRMENIATSGYNFALHKELSDAIEAAKRSKGAN